MELSNIYLGALAFLFILELCYLRPKAAPFIAFSLYLLPLTAYGGGPLAEATVSRGAAVLCAAVMLSRLKPAFGLSSLQVARPLMVYAGLAVASYVWAESPARTLNALAALLSGLALAVMMAVSNHSRPILDLISGWVLTVTCVNVLLIAVQGPSLGERFGGLFLNPNGLGVFSVLAIPLLARRYGVRSLPTGAACATLLLSGSRGALAALAVMVVMAVARIAGRLRPTVVLTIIPLLVFTLWKAFQFAQASHGSVVGIASVRSDDSRAETWSLAVYTIRRRPLLGHGYGFDIFVDPASSVLKAALEGGVVFLAVLALIGLASFRVMMRRPLDAIAFVLIPGAFTSALFESWLLAGGSLYFVLFWTAVMAIEASHLRVTPEGLPSGAGGLLVRR